MNQLERHLGRLCEWIKASGLSLTWNRILVVDASRTQAAGSVVRILRTFLIEPQAYADRFDRLLHCGFPWINLNAAGVVGDALIVIVELPAQVGDVPPQAAAVNLSGPAAGTPVEIVEPGANPEVLQRMREACNQWKARQIDCLALGRQVVELASALQGMPDSIIADARLWQQALASAWEWASSGEYERGMGRADGVVFALKAWIDDLDGAPLGSGNASA